MCVCMCALSAEAYSVCGGVQRPKTLSACHPFLSDFQRQDDTRGD